MKIQASRCKTCERAIVPPRDTCPYCGKRAGDMVSLELKGQGTVASFTTLHRPPEGFRPPLTMALVELEHKAVVLCLAKEQDASLPKIGDNVDLSLDPEDRLQFQVVS
ncbi:MAG: Zn-ribbon domain-containing OB-fold protein [Candidatus Thorarchaeota archaeon]